MTPVSTDLPRILAIEDDPVLGAYVHEHLGRSGFAVTWCQNGQEGLNIARHQPFDVVLMDILLPGLDGLKVLTQLRQSHSTPVLLMSALGAEADRISGFRLGADDYLPKPFSMAELHVRIEAILRRVALDRRPAAIAPATIHGALRFDDEQCEVFYNAQAAGLTRSEYRLLETLNRNDEEVLRRPSFISMCCNAATRPTTAASTCTSARSAANSRPSVTPNGKCARCGARVMC